MVLRGEKQKYVDTDQEDGFNELRLETSQLRYADKNLVIKCDNLQSPVISGLTFPSGQSWSNVKLLLLTAYTSKSVLSLRVSHFSELIFVLTPQQEFHSILRRCKWGGTYLLFMILARRQLCILEAHTHTRTLLSDVFSDSRAPGDPVERDRWWCLHLLTCAPSLCHLSSSLQQPRGKKHAANSPWNEILALKNVYSFIRSTPRKVLQMYLYF